MQIISNIPVSISINYVSHIINFVHCRVENTSHTEAAVSLHLYCPPFTSCSMFDQRTGHRTKCQVTFWSKYGERTSYNTKTANNNPPPENN